ncbi:MAG: hypothetical protein WCO68_02930 [Verrucomicrobiota bacterium]
MQTETVSGIIRFPPSSPPLSPKKPFSKNYEIYFHPPRWLYLASTSLLIAATFCASAAETPYLSSLGPNNSFDWVINYQGQPVLNWSVAGWGAKWAGFGWDFNPRFDSRCQDHNAVDLNGLLYEYETWLAEISLKLGWDDNALWLSRAATRRERVNR